MNKPTSVKLYAEGLTARVEVDGESIEDKIEGYQIVHRGGQAPQMIIELRADKTIEFEGEAMISLLESSRRSGGLTADELLSTIDPGELEQLAAQHSGPGVSMGDMFVGALRELMRSLEDDDGS